MTRLLLIFLSSHLFLWGTSSSLEERIPVAYKGRIRPAEAYAKLWLYEFYHAEHFKAESEISKSALEFVWDLHFKGSSSYFDKPLFWIQSAAFKKKGELDPLHLRFSYLEVRQAFFQNAATSKELLSPLILYTFLESYLAPGNRSQVEQFELSSLAPGLWVRFQDNSIKIIQSPSNPPWSFFKPGDSLANLSKPETSTLFYKLKSEAETIATLLSDIKAFENLKEPFKSMEDPLLAYVKQLQNSRLKSSEKALLIEQNFPTLERLRSSGSLLKVLPSRYPSKEWLSLHALRLHIYDPVQDKALPIGNFTLFPDELFDRLRKAYVAWEASYLAGRVQEQLERQVWHLLQEGYSKLAGTPYQEARGKVLYYPSTWQLKAEWFYYHYPLTKGLLLLYGLSALLLALSIFANIRRLLKVGMGILSIAFLSHTALLALRCYILGRPPVSNMFETILYVPWIGVLASFILYSVFRQPLVMLASSLLSLILLIIVGQTDMQQGLEPVQAVLDSQFWLIIHVLLVVGSYGLFALGSLLGHFYLGQWLYFKKETPSMAFSGKAALQSLYMGVAFLIPGTILGGIWAAQSWGRFWDWDPKESWAFISSCLYLIWIHAYRFHRIHYFGLAVGAVACFLAITFTWYGVNYILGTGLHSYGFGAGGESIYYAYVLGELLFLAWVIGVRAGWLGLFQKDFKGSGGL